MWYHRDSTFPGTFRLVPCAMSELHIVLFVKVSVSLTGIGETAVNL